jgi:hypothetical protein
MEPIFPKAIRSCGVLVDWVCLHIGGQGLMESRVEERDTLDRREFLFTEPYDLQRREVVPVSSQKDILVEGT